MHRASSRHHVLLVGIDAYPKGDALFGCVNDVDALEAIFLDRLAVPPESITKLVAPHPGVVRAGRVPEDKPTSANLRRALERLTTELVRPGDRVFFHYSGHGTQAPSRMYRSIREALVPVDAPTGGELLFDDEINDLLHRIAERTEDLTVVLDCCCSAGATRSGLAAREARVRFWPMERAFGEASQTSHRSRAAQAFSGFLSAFDPSDPGFLVAASAQSGEAAHEGRDARGVRHGAFTAAWLDKLEATPAGHFEALRWADVWHSLRARVSSEFPGQHPCIMGRTERRVFGGSFFRRDPGFPITAMDGKYILQAGTLVGLGNGATVAVYGPEPAFFPTLHSREDHHARRGLLRVESATVSSAIAVPIGAIHLEDGFRGRLVATGSADELVVGLEPFDADLAQYLESEGPFRVVPLAQRGESELEAIVGVLPDGSWWLGDDVLGADDPLARGTALDRAAIARGLLHYAAYNLPLRLTRRDRHGFGALRLRVLDARSAGLLASEELHDPPLPEAEPDPARRYRYQLVHGQPVCFAVENRSANPLYTNVINVSASGKVEILGPEQLEIASKRRQTFWLRGHLGKPFPCSISKGRDFNIERLVVVGTASPKVDLSYLQVKESFADALVSSPRATSSSSAEPSDFWTATSVAVQIVPNQPSS